MQRVKEPKMSLLTNILDSYQVARSRPNINLYPQMPINQISHYIKQAAHDNKHVILQVNPNTFTKQVIEVSGKLELSPHSSQIILQSPSEKTIHLIQPRHIRHLRLA